MLFTKPLEVCMKKLVLLLFPLFVFANVISHEDLPSFEKAGATLTGLATSSMGAKQYEVWRSSLAPGVCTPLHTQASEEICIYLSGKAEASFYFPCSRCLEDVLLQISGTIQALFLHAKFEKNELYRDFDSYENVIYYTDLKIDLYERILEAISVEIPERILCSESCKGLCPFCGENLNNDVEHTCSEKEDFFLFNSKFSGLNNLNKNNLHKKSGGN